MNTKSSATENKNLYDVIVLGVGSMGSSACYYLSKQGARVLGIEQFEIPHDQGAHAGQSRIIRKAYFEHPDYVPLLERAYHNWDQLEQITGEQIFYKTGLLYAGSPGHPIIQGVLASSEQYKINVERVDPEAWKEKYPFFNIPDNYNCLFEPEAGFLRPEKAVALYTRQAINQGAEIRTHIRVLNWTEKNGQVTVRTTNGEYYANKLVITAGPWAGKMIPALSPHIMVTRQVIAWMNINNPSTFLIGKFPCWLVAPEGIKGVYYGFPYLTEQEFGKPEGLKMAYHHPGTIADPDQVDRSVSKSEEEEMARVAKQFFPKDYLSTRYLKTCLYANSPDEHFIIDILPGYSNRVVVAAGFSGHGFKFTSVVGEVLSDLALFGKSELPIEFLSGNRF